MSVLVVGAADDVGLAGVAEPAGDPQLVVALHDAASLEGVRAPRRMVWRSTCELVEHPGGALWRRGPWPAADALFDLDPPGPGAGFLVVGGTPERRHAIAAALADRGHDGAAGDRLSVAALRSAHAVALLGTAPGAPLPAEAPAVAAARRVLITDAFAPDFGLQPGVDLTPARDDTGVVEAMDAVLAWPAAFAAQRALAAHAARAHRASEVYARLLADTAALGA